MTQEAQPNLFTLKESMSTTTEAGQKPKKRQLTVVGLLALSDWLRANTERVTACESAVAVATLASTDLSMDIGESSIRTTMSALGMEIPKPRPALTEAGAIAVLAREILAIRRHLGSHVVAPELLELADMGQASIDHQAGTH